MKDEALKMALDWAEKHGEVVLAGGGMPAVTAMNAWAKLSKAALAQPEQEPVAWMREDGTLRFAEGKVFAVNQPFYTTPPQRTWVGLTEQDKWEILLATGRHDRDDVMEMTEAKLKEKNT